MFDAIFNWIAKIRARKELLKFYRMVKKKKRDILYSNDLERFGKYYNEVELLENALAYILYTKFNYYSDFDIEWDYYHVSDIDMQKYIDDILKSDNDKESDKETYHCIIDNIDNIDNIDEYMLDTIRRNFKEGSTIEDNNSIYEWDGRSFIRYYK